jgi:hypothetical protein
MTMNLRTLKGTPPWDWSEGTGKMLLDILRDDRTSESDLLLAAGLAGDLTVVNDELVDALLFIVRRGDRSEAVRGRAAISLGPVLEHGDTQGFEDADDLPITERAFHRLQESLRQLYWDANVPKEVRRRILEASVRAPRDWHEDAIRAAYSSGDEEWRLTAVLCMHCVRGFDEQILEALESEGEDMHYQAVLAAGSSEVDEAWPHVLELVESKQTPKALLLAAIEAAAAIRPEEAQDVLGDLAESDDEEIAAVAQEALAMADLSSADEDGEDDDLVR